MTDWAEDEFGTASLGDKRLTLRLIKLATRFAEQPTASIPGACGGAAETKAAYRFFDQANEDQRELGWEAILRPHMESTMARMRAHPVVLCLQDTTELDFNRQDIGGLGPLSYEAQRGMYVHPTYVVTPQREPLGVIDAWMWVRQTKAPDGTRPGVCESQRWIEGYERVAESAVDMPDTRLVYVADREADILALMQRAHAMGTPADWLIRAQHNRCLPEGGKLWAGSGSMSVMNDDNQQLSHRALGSPFERQPPRKWMRYSPDDTVIKDGKRYLIDYKAPGEPGDVKFRYACQLHQGRMVCEHSGVHIDGMILVQLDWRTWDIRDAGNPADGFV